MMVIAADGTGDFSSLQAALDAAPADGRPVRMAMRRGVYREKVVWTKSNLHLIAEDGARLVWGDYALQTLPNGERKDTFLTATLLVSGSDNRIDRLTVENDAGDGRQVGQAVALYAAGDRLHLSHCRLLACQDTLYTGPVLKKTARWTPGLDGGVADVAAPPPFQARQYYEACFIRGDVDFIFGPYRAWFEGCTLYANARGGYYAAPNTPADQPYGLVFHRCALTGECAPGGMYLGRPWREAGCAAYLDCEMDACVHPLGFCDWESPFRPVTRRLCEHGSTGPGADGAGRHPAMGRLSDAEAARYTPRQVLDGWKG